VDVSVRWMLVDVLVIEYILYEVSEKNRNRNYFIQNKYHNFFFLKNYTKIFYFHLIRTNIGRGTEDIKIANASDTHGSF
jgi:hypothetical protein